LTAGSLVHVLRNDRESFGSFLRNAIPDRDAISTTRRYTLPNGIEFDYLQCRIAEFAGFLGSEIFSESLPGDNLPPFNSIFPSLPE